MPYTETPETNALKQYIETILAKVPDFVEPAADEKQKQRLKINVIKDCAERGDIKLLAPLLKNPTVKKAFFTPVLDSFIFNTAKFKEFLEYSSACNSYSKYLGQKIGLYMGDIPLIDRSEVVLNFPFKDCVLEGGQRKEDGLDTYFEYNDKEHGYTEKKSKRREVFYNEVLARDEIDSLFSPKAFCNAKRYESGKSSLCKKLNRNAELNKKRGLPEDTITDNLIIKGNNLLALHSLKEEFAGKVKLIYIDPPYNTGNDSFAYNDNFNRSAWLTFMKNRLEIAKDLLSDDGVLYIQLDYHQIHYAKILMDNIFGENNFQREIIWRIGWLSGYKTKDNNWIRNHDTILFYSKNSMTFKFNKYYIPKKDFKRIANSDVESYPIEDVWNGNEYDDLNSIAIVSFAGETVSKLLNKDDDVKGQKSEKLLERIIRAHTVEDDIILDFFGGTGTTAAAALKMKRKFILCEQIDKHLDISLRRLSKVIEGEQSGISKRHHWHGGGSFVYMELAEKNEQAVRLISACKNFEELISIFDELCRKYFLHYNVRIEEFREEVKTVHFQSLTLKEQKEMFCRMLDLNQLYINADDRHDDNSGLGMNDVAITEDFYRLFGDKNSCD